MLNPWPALRAWAERRGAAAPHRRRRPPHHRPAAQQRRRAAVPPPLQPKQPRSWNINVSAATGEDREGQYWANDGHPSQQPTPLEKMRMSQKRAADRMARLEDPHGINQGFQRSGHRRRGTTASAPFGAQEGAPADDWQARADPVHNPIGMGKVVREAVAAQEEQNKWNHYNHSTEELPSWQGPRAARHLSWTRDADWLGSREVRSMQGQWSAAGSFADKGMNMGQNSPDAGLPDHPEELKHRESEEMNEMKKREESGAHPKQWAAQEAERRRRAFNDGVRPYDMEDEKTEARPSGIINPMAPKSRNRYHRLAKESDHMKFRDFLDKDGTYHGECHLFYILGKPWRPIKRQYNQWIPSGIADSGYEMHQPESETYKRWIDGRREAMAIRTLQAEGRQYYSQWRGERFHGVDTTKFRIVGGPRSGKRPTVVKLGWDEGDEDKEQEASKRVGAKEEEEEEEEDERPVEKVPNPYKKLRIPGNATKAEAAEAYRKLARKYHPDAPEGSQEKMTDLNTSYELVKQIIAEGGLGPDGHWRSTTAREDIEKQPADPKERRREIKRQEKQRQREAGDSVSKTRRPEGSAYFADEHPDVSDQGFTRLEAYDRMELNRRVQEWQDMMNPSNRKKARQMRMDRRRARRQHYLRGVGMDTTIHKTKRAMRRITICVIMLGYMVHAVCWEGHTFRHKIYPKDDPGAPLGQQPIPPSVFEAYDKEVEEAMRVGVPPPPPPKPHTEPLYHKLPKASFHRPNHDPEDILQRLNFMGKKSPSADTSVLAGGTDDEVCPVQLAAARREMDIPPSAGTVYKELGRSLGPGSVGTQNGYYEAEFGHDSEGGHASRYTLYDGATSRK